MCVLLKICNFLSTCAVMSLHYVHFCQNVFFLSLCAFLSKCFFFFVKMCGFAENVRIWSKLHFLTKSVFFVKGLFCPKVRFCKNDNFGLFSVTLGNVKMYVFFYQNVCVFVKKCSFCQNGHFCQNIRFSLSFLSKYVFLSLCAFLSKCICFVRMSNFGENVRIWSNLHLLGKKFFL